ncbi:MAG: mannose-1-phosphate guanylyltransferase [Candidatus Omnitrophica bacterium]|nr:mannose-1-phosphate guanylyltransferase [Candidatus Omnitrophota bacterium]
MTKKTNVYAVILAGGSGTRFWPMSRENKPKQFLDVTGNGTLLVETLKRIKTKIKPARILIVTNAKHQKEIQRQTKSLRIPAANIMLEPQGKNTAPAIGWAAERIYRNDKNAVMAVLPSDHLITNKKNYLQTLEQAVKLAQEDYLVTFGIVPTRPETGYGYMRIAPKKGNGRSLLKVVQFTEKPNLAKAKQYLKTKKYFWNSGMFVWNVAVIRKELQAFTPKIYQLLADKSELQIKRNWTKLPSISIDYGILEKSERVVAVRAANIGWSDLGSWESLMEVLAKKKTDNIFKGDVIPIDCKGSLVWGQQRCVAVIGMDNMIVVDTPDALLICSKSQSQKVKDVVALLKARRHLVA